jgi:hypothetical protein|tara:strand:- start:754 stop:1215 length:462 start_codon:yes stop_codon:yes gene_type:complete
MKFQRILSLPLISLLVISCGANKIVYPTQIEYTANPQLILDEFIPYIELQGYSILNTNDTRMTLRNQNGFYTAEYLETDWMNSGVYDEPSGKEFIIKQKVWIILDSNQISVKSVFGFMDGEEMVVFDSAPDELYKVVNALPEGLKQMILSKAL